MSRIFISHSSKDAKAAKQMSAWLSREGWDDHFLDLDPQRGIKAGERWQHRLRESQNQCEAVLLLLSPAWAESRWCETEYLVASQLNKQIIGAIVEPVAMDALPTTLTSEWQIVDLTSDRDAFSDEGLNRLKDGIARLGIGSWHFQWPPDTDPDRPVFPGLRPLEEDDAGIFFGRDGEILRALDQLRGLRRAGSGAFIIQGASGAGKSSFLRAGLIRRLQRENDIGQVLPVMRSGRSDNGAFGNLTEGLAQAFASVGQQKAARTLRTQIANNGLPDLLKELAAASAKPSLILPIDQGEELLDATRPDADLILKSLSAAVLDPDLDLVVLMTIRSDRWEDLQTHAAFSTLTHTTFSLPPLPLGSYADIIRRPLQRLHQANRGIDFDEKLIDRLLSDIATGGASDGLPLLAFTLERLWREFGSSGAITLTDYETTGGISGAINAAVERALTLADEDRSIPLDRQAKIALLRRGFIPWLAGIDVESGRPVRNIALASEIPQEAMPIIELMADQRLLIRDVDAQSGNPTFEPTHEAILRQWTLVGDWLGEQIQDFVAIDGVKRAARDWNANGRDGAWISHQNTRLDLAQKAASGTHGKRLSRAETEYMAAAGDAWAQRIALQKRGRRLKLFAGGAALAASLCAAAVLWVFWQNAKAAERETFAALKVSEARAFLDRDAPERALFAARQGWRAHGSAETRSAFMQSLAALPDPLSLAIPPGKEGPVALAWMDETTLLFGYRSGRISRLDTATAQFTDPYLTLAPAEPPKDGSQQTLIALSAAGGHVAGLFGNGVLTRIDPFGQSTDHAPSEEYTVFLKSFEDVTFDTSQLIYVQEEQPKSFLVTDCRTTPCTSERLQGEALDLSRDGARIALANTYEVRIFDLGTKPERADFSLPESSQADIVEVSWSQDGRSLRVLDTDSVTYDIDTSDMSVTTRPDVPHEPARDIRFFRNVEDTSWFTCFTSSICAEDKTRNVLRQIPIGFSDGATAFGFPLARWTDSGDKLATLHPDGWVRVWSTARDGAALRFVTPTRALDVPMPGQDIYLALRNEQVYALDQGGAARFVQGADAAPIRDRIDIDVRPTGEIADLSLARKSQITASSETVREVHWINNDLVIATPTADNSVLFLDAQTGAERARTAPLPETPWSAVAHPDGKRLIVSTTDGALHWIDIETAQQDGTFLDAQAANDWPDANALGAANISISADGAELIAGRADAHVIVYDLNSGAISWSTELPSSTARQVAFAPVSRKLAVLASDGTLTVWSDDKTLWGSVDVRIGGLVPTDFTWFDDDRLVVQSDTAGIKIIDLRQQIWLDRAQSLLRAMDGE